MIAKYKNVDPACKATFLLFAKLYARAARNFALDALSRGGLYFAGGITIKNREILTSKAFKEEFEKDLNVNAILKDMPIYLINNYEVSLFGAAYAALLRNDIVKIAKNIKRTSTI